MTEIREDKFTWRKEDITFTKRDGKIIKRKKPVRKKFGSGRKPPKRKKGGDVS